MDKHITVVGAIHIAFGVLGVLLGVLIFLSVAGGGLLTGDEEAIAITTGIATVIASVMMFVSVPGIIAGIFLLQRREWARVLTIVLGTLQLLNLPLGTAAGIYTLWVLLNDESKQYFVQQPLAA